MTRLTPAAVSALLLSAFAGSADAQFVAEEKSSPVAHVAPDAASSGVQTIVTTSGDGTVYKLVARDGSIDGVWINNEPVPGDRIVRSDRAVRLLGKDGAVLHEFRLGGPATPPVLRGMTPGGRDVWAMSAPAAPKAPGAAPLPPPPVMLGINLSEPGAALRAQLGLGDRPVILVDGVIDGLPAAEAGLKQYDVIVSLDGSDDASSETLSKVLRDKKPGDVLKMHVIRGGEKKSIEATLAAYDPQKLNNLNIELSFNDDDFPQITIEQDDEGNVMRWVERRDGLRQKLEALTAEEAEAAQDAAMRAAEQAMRRSEEIQRKVEQAMRDAERKVLELRGDRLFVRPAEEAADMARELERQVQRQMPEIRGELDARLAAMERRFDALERDLEARLERLTSVMERLADRLEKADAKKED